MVTVQTSGTDPPATDHLPELAILMHTATREINKHTNDRGRCMGCGLVWPCERALLAEHNLAVL
jgi:hypothetical protein